MLRVGQAEERWHTTVTIDGQLAGNGIGIVEACCDDAMSKGKPVLLFLRDVSAVDRAGRALLCRLAAKGIGLLAHGVYTSYLVKALGTPAKR